MSIEQAIEGQTQAMYALTDAIDRMIEQNQRMIEVMIEVMAEGSEQPMRDMDGNPVHAQAPR